MLNQCDQAISQIIDGKSSLERDTSIQINDVRELSEIMKATPVKGKKDDEDDNIEVNSNMLDTLRNEFEQEKLQHKPDETLDANQKINNPNIKKIGALSPSDSMPFELH